MLVRRANQSDINPPHRRVSRLARYIYQSSSFLKISRVVTWSNALVLQITGASRGITSLLTFTLKHCWPFITLKSVKELWWTKRGKSRRDSKLCQYIFRLIKQQIKWGYPISSITFKTYLSPLMSTLLLKLGKSPKGFWLASTWVQNLKVCSS